MSSMENSRLSEIYDFQYGTGNNNPDNGGIYPIYGSNGIIGGYSKYNSEDSPVIGHIGANCGAVVFGKGKHFVTYNGVICKIKKGVDSQFGYYVLLASNLKRLGFGSAQPFISYGTLKRVAIYKPNYDIQVKLGRILSNYDQLIENNNKRIKLLEQMAEELYKEWFVRFIFPEHMKAKIENGIPEGWSIKKIKEVVKRLPFGQTYKGSELSESGEVIVIDQSTEEYLGFHDGEASHKASFGEPLLLFGDHTCKYQLMCKDFSLGENIIPYRNVDSSIDRYFLFYATKDIIKTEEYKRHWGRFVNFKILIPPIELQKEYREIVIRFEKEKNVLWDQNQNLIKQRDSLLPRLMSGKLSVEGKEIV